MPSMGPAIPSMRTEALRADIPTAQAIHAQHAAIDAADPVMTGGLVPGGLESLATMVPNVATGASSLFPLVGALALAAFMWWQSKKASKGADMGGPGRALRGKNAHEDDDDEQKRHTRAPRAARRKRRKHQFADTVSDQLLDEVKTLAQAKQCPKAVALFLKRRVLGAGASSSDVKKRVEHVGEEVAYWCSSELQEAAEQSARDREFIEEMTTSGKRESDASLKRSGYFKPKTVGYSTKTHPDDPTLEMPTRPGNPVKGARVTRRRAGEEQSYVVYRQGKYTRSRPVKRTS